MRNWKGVIFDLDGTLVDSQLDFAAMRADLGLSPGTPILEAIESWIGPARAEAEAILLRHELRGADCAVPMPGVPALLARLAQQALPCAIFTRNARVVARHTLARLGLDIDLIVAREDAPPKPDPAGLVAICRAWGLAARDVVFIGDYLYDLEAGARAGIDTILYAPEPPDFPHQATLVIDHFDRIFPK